ncbi:hypothetical protein [Pandoraea morbifera]|nr:hypothetical protein [Pandoraea morbifera]
METIVSIVALQHGDGARRAGVRVIVALVSVTATGKQKTPKYF